MNNGLELLFTGFLKHPGYIAILAGAVVIKFITLFVPTKRRRRSYRNNDTQQRYKTEKRPNTYAKPEKLHISATDGLINQSEKKLFLMLRDALPDYYIFPQVSFNALITHAYYVKNNWWRNLIRKRFNTKFVDFVLCDKETFRVIAIIEYDGQGHDYKDDAYRDGMLQDANYRIERFNESDTLESIKNRFRELATNTGNYKYQDDNTYF